MTESPRIEEEKIIKYVKDLFRLKQVKKETIDTSIKDIRHVFRLQKENKGIKDRIIRDNRNVFELEEDDYNKSVRVGKFRSKIYIEYKSKGDRKTLSVEEYLNKIKRYLKDIIDDLKISDR